MGGIHGTTQPEFRSRDPCTSLSSLSGTESRSGAGGPESPVLVTGTQNSGQNKQLRWESTMQMAMLIVKCSSWVLHVNGHNSSGANFHILSIRDFVDFECLLPTSAKKFNHNKIPCWWTRYGINSNELKLKPRH
jgi:hypothetical protein